jgi:hypothetical protein
MAPAISWQGARTTAASDEQYLMATDVALSHPAEKLI